jgi:hypothetical protein
MSIPQQLQLWSEPLFLVTRRQGANENSENDSPCQVKLLHFTFSTWGQHFVSELRRSQQMQKVLDSARPYTLLRLLLSYRALPYGAFILSPFHIPKKEIRFFFCSARYIFFISILFRWPLHPIPRSLSPQQAARWRSRFLHC